MPCLYSCVRLGSRLSRYRAFLVHLVEHSTQRGHGFLLIGIGIPREISAVIAQVKEFMRQSLGLQKIIDSSPFAFHP